MMCVLKALVYKEKGGGVSVEEVKRGLSNTVT